MKFELKDQEEENEDVVKLFLEKGRNQQCVQLRGTDKKGHTDIIMYFNSNGKFSKSCGAKTLSGIVIGDDSYIVEE